MTDKESTPKSKKRVVGIKTAIALIIVVVLLAAVLGYSMYYYTAEINSKNNTLSSMNNELNSKNSTIQSLNSQIISLNNQIANLKAQLSTSNGTIQSLSSQINTLNSEISSLNNQIANLKAQLNTSNGTIANLQEILSLNETTVEISDQTISQPAGYYTYWTFSIPYAGYIVVEVLSSTSTNTYAIVSWSSYGVDYSDSVTVGSSGTVNFPVLPSSNVVVGVGNSDLIIGATETVTILYYY